MAAHEPTDLSRINLKKSNSIARPFYEWAFSPLDAITWQEYQDSSPSNDHWEKHPIHGRYTFMLQEYNSGGIAKSYASS